MKKILLVVLSCVLVLCFTACGAPELDAADVEKLLESAAEEADAAVEELFEDAAEETKTAEESAETTSDMSEEVK